MINDVTKSDAKAGEGECRSALRERFTRLSSRIGLDIDQFDLLDQYYSEPGRHYHGWRHIWACLREFDSIAHLLSDPLAVELALWFHDAVYIPGGNRNELDSAELAFRSLRPVGIELAWKVKTFIEATDYSRTFDTTDPDLDYLKDIDFAAFGKPFDAFWQDVERLRQENGENSRPAASVRRLAFYRQILDGRVELFRTAHFRDRLLEQALDNVGRALHRLEHGDG